MNAVDAVLRVMQLFLLPAAVVHELAHAVAADMVDADIREVSIWPHPYVDVAVDSQRSEYVDAFVGLAPYFVAAAATPIVISVVSSYGVLHPVGFYVLVTWAVVGFPRGADLEPVRRAAAVCT